MAGISIRTESTTDTHNKTMGIRSKLVQPVVLAELHKDLSYTTRQKQKLHLQLFFILVILFIPMIVTDEHRRVAKMLEDELLRSKTNSTVVQIGRFYEMAGRERLTEKFYGGVAAAGESRHLLIAFGENVVAVTRDVGP